jgi:osmotically-inducible protein OsmY
MAEGPPSGSEIVDAVRVALAGEPRIGADLSQIRLAFESDAVVMEGVVADVAAKKLALERAAAVPGVTGIVDRLHTRPAQEMDDARVRALVLDAFLQEPAFGDLALRERIRGDVDPVREPPDATQGVIDVEVVDGVVLLNGSVPGLDHKRLAGVLAWWVPGSRDVINGMAVDPDEEDNPGSIADAVRTAHEKDPFVDAAQIRIDVADADVTLRGLVRTPEEREMAEFDAWYVFGVDRVANLIEIEHG